MTASPQSALDWEGQTMLDRAGARIGRIEEIFVVEETGQPEWALVKVGRLKSHTTLVPLTSAQPVGDAIKVGYDKDVVSDAPLVDPDDEPSEQQVNAVYGHYGIDLGKGNGSVPPRQEVVVNGSLGDLRDEPIGDLVKQVSAEAKTLAGQQFKLAKTELTEKAKDVGIGAGMVGGAGYALHLAALGLLLTIIFALATAMQAWLAALIVTVVFAAIAGALALKGKQRIKQAGPPVPEHTIESVKQTIETVKEEATWGLGQTR
jgi:uncharacterized membrane protein YqjE